MFNSAIMLGAVTSGNQSNKSILQQVLLRAFFLRQNSQAS
jgi:hypothetical protein